MDRAPLEAPGLKWRPRKHGFVPYWVPRADAVAAGYPSGTINFEPLVGGALPEKRLDPADGTHELVAARCRRAQDEMLYWLNGHRRDRSAYDGSLGSALRIYESHPDSRFRRLKPGSRVPYASYLRRLHDHVGGRAVAAVTGHDVQQWHKVWSRADARGRPTRVAAGAMAFAVLKAAVKWGAVLGIDDCRRFFAVLELVEIPKPKRRRMVATAADVVAARAAAHRHGAPSRALAYAIQFETALRQWDVKGQWYPLADPVLSSVSDPALGKWVGLQWRHIGPDLVLRYTPSKTEDSSEVEIVVDLSLCPMALEELAHVPAAARSGPVIVNEARGLPYTKQQFEDGWRRDFKAAGLPATLWNRDMRASAVTEARGGPAPASIDDAATVAGHSERRTTAEVYDRERLEAFRRFQNARLTRRND